MMDQVEGKRRDIPLWLGAVLITIGVAAGGWFIWWQLSGFFSGKPRVFKIDGVNPDQAWTQQGPPQGNWAANTDEFRAISPDRWRIRSSAMHIFIVKGKDGLSVHGEILGPAQFHTDYTMVQLARRVRTPALKEIGLNDQQIKQLQSINGSLQYFPSRLSDAEIAKVKDLFGKWQSADPAGKITVQRDMIAFAKSNAAAKTAAAREQAAKMVSDFRKSVTEQQWNKIRDAAMASVPRPATRPAQPAQRAVSATPATAATPIAPGPTPTTRATPAPALTAPVAPVVPAVTPVKP